MQNISLTDKVRTSILRIMKNDAIFYISLKEIAKVSAGYPLRGSAEALSAGKISLIQLKNADPDTDIDWDAVNQVELPTNRTPKWLTSNDVIFSARGIKNYAYAMTDAPEKTVCSPHFFVLSAMDSQKILPEFLAWQINQRPAQNYLRRVSDGTQAVSNIKRQSIEEMPLALPSVRQQTLIIKFWQAAQKERAALTNLITNRNYQSDAIAYGLFDQAKETY